MTLLPQLEPLLAQMSLGAPLDPDSPLTERRARMDEMTARMFGSLGSTGPEMLDERTHRVPIGDADIRVRVYRAVEDVDAPCHVYLHGGGFWLGNIDLYDAHCRRTAAGLGGVVVSIGYRLAPESRFPGPVEDAYSGLCWAVEHADDLGIDPARLTVGGASAGGNLAAALCLVARDRGGPSIRGQVLQLPSTDFTMGSRSMVENGEGYGLTRTGIMQCREYYIPDPEDWRHPYASPGWASDVRSLPPALIITAEYDPLRDEGEAYGHQLAAAGVPVVLQRALGHIHGSLSMTKLIPEAAVFGHLANQFLRHASSRS